MLLIDRQNYHTFVPLLYQVATGYIEPEAIAIPLRTALRNIPNADFLKAEVTKIDFEAQTVLTDGKAVRYDYLVIATGSEANFLQVSGAPHHAFPLRTLDDAVALRHRIMSCLEQAVKNISEEQHPLPLDPLLQERLLTFTIVGGGPTGVEMAGALQELLQDCLKQDYPLLDLTQSRVVLLQSGSSLLASYPKNLQNHVATQLRRREVKVHFNSKVKAVTDQKVILENDTAIETATVVWTAGVAGSLPKTSNEIPTDSKNKVKVTPTLQLAAYPNVYGIGDTAHVKQEGEPLVGIAPEALQQGSAIARNLQRQLAGKPPQDFNYFNKGRAAIVARGVGVILLLGKIPVGGFFGWFAWLAIHLYYLPGFWNRVRVLTAWLRDIFASDRYFQQIINGGARS